MIPIISVILFAARHCLIGLIIGMPPATAASKRRSQLCAAAVPFEKWHILYNYDFSNSRTYRVFFDDIMSVRAIGANVDENASLEPEDKVIILSTCLKGNKDKRYLVCAKLVGNE